MRMSTRGRFGLRALLYLAVCERETAMSVSALAEKMTISADYLMQLFVKLRRAGLVKSVRGPRGGFRLARPPARISVGDIVRAVEGPMAVTACLDHRPKSRSKKGTPPCPKAANCVARIVWEDLTEEIARLLDATTLAGIISEARRRGLLKA